jgi:hypothetical protein
LVHLSVAIGRFAEILFWAIMRAAGMVAGLTTLGLLALLLVWLGVRRAYRGRRR